MNAPSTGEVAQQLTHLQTQLNMVWTLLCGFLIMFMQAGFALLESGLTRAKNVGHTMGMNFLVYSIGLLGFWAVGFALQMGGVGALGTLGGETTLSSEFSITIAGKAFGLFGTEGFFLSPQVFTPAVATVFLFQMMFMDTTCTIPTGALAERWRFVAFAGMSLLISTLIYPVYANWVWGGGFLSTLGLHFGLGHGHVDFAGSSVVHMTGGVLALVGAKVVGPRYGKFALDGSPRAIPGHNIPMAVLGTFILAFGWFGFNAGSTLAGTDSRVAIVAVNTMLSSAAGALSATLYVWRKFGKPDPSWMCNGMLAGLVAITAPCAFVNARAAVAIGAVAGLLVIHVAVFVESRLRIDDPVGACAVHGANGIFGTLCVGLFADGTYGDGLNGVSGPVRGLLYGDGGQLVAQAVGVVANLLYVGAMALAGFKLIDLWVGNRVSPSDEIMGLDVPEMGSEGYPVEEARPAYAED